MEIIRQEEQKDKDTTLRKIVEEVLRGLQVLHRAGVIHRDIKPGNVLIDSRKNARLADFGLSHKLEEGRSTVHTARAGTIGWEATEILNHHTGYKKSSDIQVAGMLVYYILSDGKHPFGDMKDREENIKKGQYFLKHLQDIVANDLVDGMIKKDPAKRLTIDEVLDHLYFWDDDRRSQMKTAHILDVSGASVHPKEGITPRRETDPNFFEIKTSLGNDLKMTLIREEDKKIVWTAMTEKDELDQIHPQREESRLKSEADKARYFNEHWSDLIQRVTNVKIIADKLLQQRIIHEEQYSEIEVSLTNQEGMRKICDIVRKHSDAVKAKLISILQEEKLFHF